MGRIILNGNQYGGGGGGGSADIVEVTLAEYIALGDVVNTDGKLYCITDLNNSDVQGYPPLIYSTDEREVGVWKDGKPLYQKTITFDCSNTSNVQTAYSIPTTDFIVAVLDAYFENSYNNLSQQTRYTWYKDHFWSYIVNNSGHAISVHKETTDGNWQTGVKFIATIQYTKTTDTAGSGIWNGQGGYAHHYSTSEKVIGTWINGKPLYEVSISLTSGITVGSYGHVTLPADSVIRDLFGLVYRNNYKSMDKFNGYIDNGDIFCSIRSGNLEYYISNIFSGIEELDFTVQYTKTTD